jgi:hypothetical protein
LAPRHPVTPPWGDGDFIRAEAPDAAGTYVCGIESAVWDPGDQLQHYSDVLSYICQIHNARLTEQPQQLALADARAETAELELAHLRNAYDVLFETHQREMDRLHQERDRALAALRDLLAGAEQQSQSHADVIAKCRAALAVPDSLHEQPDREDQARVWEEQNRWETGRHSLR